MGVALLSMGAALSFSSMWEYEREDCVEDSTIIVAAAGMSFSEEQKVVIRWGRMDIRLRRNTYVNPAASESE